MALAGAALDSTALELPGVAQTAAGVSQYFTMALGGALDDAFVVGGVVASLAIVSALMLRPGRADA